MRSNTELSVLGLLFEGSDPSAALVVNGKVEAFAEEERFTRVKHAMGAFPVQASRFCLKQAGLKLEDVGVIAVGWEVDKFDNGTMASFYERTCREDGPVVPRVRAWQQKNLGRYTKARLMEQLKDGLLRSLRPGQWPEIRFVRHHFAHACSTFSLSGFEEAAIITADGHGEEDCTNIWAARNGRIEHLQQWDIPQSLGWFYTKFTQFFGFRAHDGEGKLMGLAAYGRPDRELASKVAKIIRLTGDDSVYRMEPRFFYQEFAQGGPFTKEWLELFGEPREFESKEPFSQYQKDLAFAVQDALELVGMALLEHALKLTGSKRVCTAGGTFMNCKMNGVLARHIGLENYFVQPAAGDNGIALGAALAPFQEAGYAVEPMSNMYLGPAYSESEMESALKEASVKYHKADNVASEAAELLAQSKVVGWYQGRMEAGARALGNRSIVANPLDPAMSDLVNQKVKFREPWRPFCPSTMEEEGAKYFDYDGKLPYMIVACDARPGEEQRLPSVVHIDQTVRVQTVNKDVNPRYHALISAFKEKTGHGVVLNTSFNIKGEPIVCRPKEAVNCFLNTAIDALVMGDFIAIKD